VGGTLKIIASVLGVVFLAISSGSAQEPRSTAELVACINEMHVNGTSVNISAVVRSCVPQGCKVTASMSAASAQPACNLSDSQLPRVFLNCQGSSAGLRFRPTFTLCPNEGNRIEVGEDVAPIAPSPASPLQMANIQIPMDQPIPHPLTGYLNTPNNNIRCTRCHGNAVGGITGDTPLLSNAFDPFTVQRRNLLPLVIYSTEPTRKALISPSGTLAGRPIVAQTLDQICGRIDSVLENNLFAFGAASPTQTLCRALAAYTTDRSCGRGAGNLRCGGVTGGGIFVANGVSSTVALEFSGQAASDPERPEKFTFRTNDVDGTLTALNGATQTTINAVALSDLEELDGVDADGVQGDGNYTFTGAGKAWLNGVTTPIAVRISFNKAENLSRVSVTSPDGAEFYAGGTAVGVRFTVTTKNENPTQQSQ
jgi:hypothetical protein